MQVNRRQFLIHIFGLLLAPFFGSIPFVGCTAKITSAEVFIGKAGSYTDDIALLIRAGLRELNVMEHEIRGKRILLKANLVEPHRGLEHINTHPLLLRGAIEAFRNLGALTVLVAEGSGHCRDTYRILEQANLADVLHDGSIPFVDLNYQDWYSVPNRGSATKLATFSFPEILRQVDWIVSMPKMKTHHWAGVTLSMKNLFGVMPGMFYGWPKNVLHAAGIERCILDINTTLQTHFAIVDGIVGMEGDGPIMGTPKPAGVLVMGRNFPAVDATCCRVMGINPGKITYLSNADKLGPIREKQIFQRGETIQAVRTNFKLIDKIEAHRRLM